MYVLVCSRYVYGWCPYSLRQDDGVGSLEIARTYAEGSESIMKGGGGAKIQACTKKNEFLSWSTKGAANPQQQSAAANVGRRGAFGDF